MESPKRLRFAEGFSLPFFRKNKDKPPSADKAEKAERKALVQEGHKYLSETTELVLENRDHPHIRDTGYLRLFEDRWSELYGSAPSGKKLTKGRLNPEEFRNEARELLEDAQTVLETGKLDARGGSSSQHHQTETSQEMPIPQEAPGPPLEHSKSIGREPSHRRRELRDDPVPPPVPHDLERSGTGRHKERRDSDPHPASRKSSTRHRRAETEDEYRRPTVENIPEELGGRGDREREREPPDTGKSRRHRQPTIDKKQNERSYRYPDSPKYSNSDGSRDGDGRRRREDRRREEKEKDRYKDDRYRDDRPRDDRYRYRDEYYKDDRYRDDRRRDDRKDDSYRKDRYRDDRYRDDRYRDDRYRDRDDRYRDTDRRKDDKYYYDSRGSDRRGGERYYEDKYSEGRRRDDPYRDDRYRDRRRGDEPRSERRHRDEPPRGDRQRLKEEIRHEQELEATGSHPPPRGAEEGEEGEEIPVAMSPTYIPYPSDDEKPRHRQRRGRPHESNNHHLEEGVSRNHSLTRGMGHDSEHPPMSPDPDLERTSPYMGDPAL